MHKALDISDRHRVPLAEVFRQSRAVHAVEQSREQHANDEERRRRCEVQPDAAHSGNIAITDSADEPAAAKVCSGHREACLQLVNAFAREEEFPALFVRRGVLVPATGNNAGRYDSDQHQYKHEII